MEQTITRIVDEAVNELDVCSFTDDQIAQLARAFYSMVRGVLVGHMASIYKLRIGF